MIVVMKTNCNEEAIEHILTFLHNHGLSGHPSRGVERTIIGVLGAVGPTGTPGSIGGINPSLGETLETLPCVSEGVVRLGDRDVVMMAGPCTVETEKQLMTTAHAVRKAGAVILRGGAFKPSTSPYGFRGLGEEGLRLLAKARSEYGLAVITEVMTPTDVPMVCEYADILQIGTRNMQNYMLLDEVGRAEKPVLLKRG